MKQRIKRILACMLAIVAAFTAVFSNVTPAMAVSAEAALSYWDASAKDVGEVSEIKPDFYWENSLWFDRWAFSILHELWSSSIWRTVDEQL